MNDVASRKSSSSWFSGIVGQFMGAIHTNASQHMESRLRSGMRCVKAFGFKDGWHFLNGITTSFGLNPLPSHRQRVQAKNVDPTEEFVEEVRPWLHSFAYTRARVHASLNIVYQIATSPLMATDQTTRGLQRFESKTEWAKSWVAEQFTTRLQAELYAIRQLSIPDLQECLKYDDGRHKIGDNLSNVDLLKVKEKLLNTAPLLIPWLGELADSTYEPPVEEGEDEEGLDGNHTRTTPANQSATRAPGVARTQANAF